MNTITLKFGGSSLADAAQFQKVKKIIDNHSGRYYVVASAPGKRFKEDTKVTDMLYACYNMAAEKKDFSKQLSDIKARFENISSELKLNFDFESEFATIKDSLDKNPQKDYMASRGEYLNSKLLAYYLGFDFVDPATGIYFDKDGNLDAEKTNKAMGKILKNKDKAVIAGFYGSDINGQVKTFSRGGSDVTGSIVARATKSDVYENWTDVSGMLSADPRIVKDPQPIKKISYKELRELSYMGASV
ncbi:MAG: aspartate kinase, partial [Sphaerochaetaceae bacterium]|nr:aspartate kinase [Sphaerochaetaceae bacterium]